MKHKCPRIHLRKHLTMCRNFRFVIEFNKPHKNFRHNKLNSQRHNPVNPKKKQ